MALDVFPVTVRGPMTSNRQGVATFARLFEHNGRLYLATSRDKGRTVESVTAYELPEGKPTRPGKAAKFGPWTYTGCGCTNSWGRHKREALATMVSPETD